MGQRQLTKLRYLLQVAPESLQGSHLTVSLALVRLYFPRKIPVFCKRSEMFVPSLAGYSSLSLVYSLTSYLCICYSLCLECCSLTLWSANPSCKMSGKVSPWFRHLTFWAPTEFTPTLCESAQRSSKKMLF